MRGREERSRGMERRVGEGRGGEGGWGEGRKGDGGRVVKLSFNFSKNLGGAG